MPTLPAEIFKAYDIRGVVGKTLTAPIVRAIGSALGSLALERARDALCNSVRDADGLALGDVVHPHPVLGPINLYQWIAFVGGHEARHAVQVMELRDLLSS